MILTVVAASVLCEAVSADSLKFGCDSDDYFCGAQYDVDYSDYSDYDEYDELDCYSDVHGGVGPANYFAPNDMEFMHRYEIRPYGHYAPMDGELSRGMNDPANYDPVPGKISPESGSVMAMSDSVSDIDPGPRGPLLPSGVNLNMSDFADIDSVSQVPLILTVCRRCRNASVSVNRGPGRPGRSPQSPGM